MTMSEQEFQESLKKNFDKDFKKDLIRKLGKDKKV
jgi:hypothetical protein